MQLTSTSLTSTVLLMWQTLQARGLDADAIFRTAGLDPKLLSDPNARYADQAVDKLWELVNITLKDPCIGLEVARHYHPTTLHALGFSWMASATLQQAFERLIRYACFITDRKEYRFIETDEDFRFEIHPGVGDNSNCVEDNDASFAVLLEMCRSIYGTDFNPLHIEFARPEPPQPCMGEFHELFRAPLTFNAPAYVMHFDKAMLQQELPTANAELARANDAIVTEYLSRLHDSDIVLQVKRKLTEQLPSGKASQESIAQSLGLSARGLQRRLGAVDKNYLDILTETRHGLAIEHLCQSSLSLGEIAYLLGFGEVSNFSRAFKRWTGLSPSEYRRRNVK